MLENTVNNGSRRHFEDRRVEFVRGMSPCGREGHSITTWAGKFMILSVACGVSGPKLTAAF